MVGVAAVVVMVFAIAIDGRWGFVDARMNLNVGLRLKTPHLLQWISNAQREKIVILNCRGLGFHYNIVDYINQLIIGNYHSMP